MLGKFCAGLFCIALICGCPDPTEDSRSNLRQEIKDNLGKPDAANEVKKEEPRFDLPKEAVFPGFQRVDGWPNTVKTRRVGESFSEEIVHVEHDPKGDLWALREASEFTESYVRAKRFLEKYDREGRQILSIAEPEHTAFNVFVVHPSGEITLAATRRISSATTEFGKVHNIWLKRLDSRGRLLFETPLIDAGNVKERTYYDFDFGNSESLKHTEIMNVEIHDGLLSTYSSNHERLIPIGEGVCFAARTFGNKIYRLSGKLEMLWSRQVMPFSDMHYAEWFSFVSERIAVDEHENIFVAARFNGNGIVAWEKHFDNVLPKESTSSTLFVAKFDRDGNFNKARLFGNGSRLFPQGISIRDGILTVGASTRNLEKFEMDLVFLRAKMSGEILAYREINFQRDDLPNDFKVDAKGNGYFAGTNDYVQVRTGSRVEFGQGFILKVDPLGNTLNYIPLRGPRHAELRSISIAGSGEVVFGGHFNGPITHTADEDRTQGFMWGFLGFADLK